MTCEVERRVLVTRAEIESATGDGEFVAAGGASRDDFAAGRDDDRVADLRDAFLDAGLRYPDHPGAVLIGAGLHDELVVKMPERIVFGRGRIVNRGVVAEQDH